MTRADLIGADLGIHYLPACPVALQTSRAFIIHGNPISEAVPSGCLSPNSPCNPPSLFPHREDGGQDITPQNVIAAGGQLTQGQPVMTSPWGKSERTEKLTCGRCGG